MRNKIQVWTTTDFFFFFKISTQKIHRPFEMLQVWHSWPHILKTCRGPKRSICINQASKQWMTLQIKTKSIFTGTTRTHLACHQKFRLGSPSWSKHWIIRVPSPASMRRKVGSDHQVYSRELDGSKSCWSWKHGHSKTIALDVQNRVSLSGNTYRSEVEQVPDVHALEHVQ